MKNKTYNCSQINNNNKMKFNYQFSISEYALAVESAEKCGLEINMVSSNANYVEAELTFDTATALFGFGQHFGFSKAINILQEGK